MSFSDWMEECCEKLACNNSSDYNEVFETFDLSEEELYSRMDELKEYYNRGFEPEEVLRKFD